MKKVLTFGTFDLFHKGHEYFLKESKKQGEKLVVLVARDETVKKIKGFFPNEDETVRMMKVMSSNIADEVLLGEKSEHYSVLGRIRPDIICLGYDQTAFIDKLNNELKKIGLEKTKIIRIKSYKPELYKSSKIRERIKG